MTSAVIEIPDGLIVEALDGGQMRFDTTFDAGDTGDADTEVRGPPRWLAVLTSDDTLGMRLADVWRALVLAMRGRINRLAVYDTARPEPLGTFRGAPTVVGDTDAGEVSIILDGGAGQAGKTFVKGDWIGFNQTSGQRQVVHVQADAVADGSGVIEITFEPYLRVDVADGSDAVWDKPTWLGRQNKDQSTWKSRTVVQGGFSLDLIEAWLPA